MEPVIKKFEAMTIMGLRTRFISALSPETNASRIIPPLWERFNKRLAEVQTRTDEKSLGVVFPIGAKEPKTDEHEMIYMAAVAVKNTLALPSGMLPAQVPAGNYAVFTHKGKVDKLEDTMDAIYSEWLPRSGKTVRDAPHLEIYDKRYIPNSESSVFEIAVPIV